MIVTCEELDRLYSEQDYETSSGIHKTNHFRKGTATYIYAGICRKKSCNNHYLTNKYRPSKFCSRSCSRSDEFHHMFGKKHSKETRSIMSESHKGEKNFMYGRKLSEKTRNKISLIHKNKVVSYETRKKLSDNHARLSGDDHPNWKGGISCEPYCQIWSDKEYKESIKQRDGHKCLNPDCWKTHKTLSIHHIDYNKKSCGPENLITICRSCNGRANKNRSWHKAWYQAIMYKRYGYVYSEVGHNE